MERLDKNAAMACSLNDADFRERRALARKTLLPKVTSSRRTRTGLVVTFSPSDTIRTDLDTFVSLEKQCCEFLTFEITPDESESGQLLTLHIDGPPDAAATIEMFAQATERRKK